MFEWKLWHNFEQCVDIYIFFFSLCFKDNFERFLINAKIYSLLKHFAQNKTNCVTFINILCTCN